MHLTWLHDAVKDHGGTPEDAPEPQVTRRRATSRRRSSGCSPPTATRPRRSSTAGATASSTSTNARLRTLLRLVLGETLEQKRFFDQALAGRTDLLGRRADGAGTKGAVLPTRWVN